MRDIARSLNHDFGAIYEMAKIITIFEFIPFRNMVHGKEAHRNDTRNSDSEIFGALLSKKRKNVMHAFL